MKTPSNANAAKAANTQPPAAGQAAHTFPQLTADACLDAQGFVTLRPSDGSPNGDTDAQPVATVYRPENAAFIVRACNENAKLHELVDVNVIARCDAQDRADKLADALRDLLSCMGEPAGKPTPGTLAESYEKARSALAAAKP